MTRLTWSRLVLKEQACSVRSIAATTRVGDGSVGHGSMGHIGRHYSMGHMGHGSVGADP